jgi:aminocarboxymuconate-semialdehyde decarboxylase
MIIDFHNHFYPPEYIKALREPDSGVRVTDDAAGNPVIHYPGDFNVAVPGHRDIAFREKDVTKAGLDLQIITLTTPGTHVESPARAVHLARLVNDAFATVVRERPDHFRALATLPLNDPAASVLELERAMKQLGMKGAMVFSNVNGVALADARYEPLWKKADELGAVIHIHPESPVGVEAMTNYWLMPLVGFLMDTTLAAAHLVFAGVPERYPRITWALGHLGGAVPYIAERFDRGYRAFEECRRNISRPPSEYLREFYYDTVNFDPNALQLAIKFAGAGHILGASDYPHAIGSIPLMLEALGSLPVSKADREAILGGNARRLLDL